MLILVGKAAPAAIIIVVVVVVDSGRQTPRKIAASRDPDFARSRTPVRRHMQGQPSRKAAETAAPTLTAFVLLTIRETGDFFSERGRTQFCTRHTC